MKEEKFDRYLNKCLIFLTLSAILITIIGLIVVILGKEIDTENLYWWGNKEYYNEIPLCIYNNENVNLSNTNLMFNITYLKGMNITLSEGIFKDNINKTNLQHIINNYTINKTTGIIKYEGIVKIPFLETKKWNNNTYVLFFNSSREATQDNTLIEGELYYQDTFDDGNLNTGGTYPWIILSGTPEENGGNLVINAVSESVRTNSNQTSGVWFCTLKIVQIGALHTWDFLYEDTDSYVSYWVTQNSIKLRKNNNGAETNLISYSWTQATGTYLLKITKTSLGYYELYFNDTFIGSVIDTYLPNQGYMRIWQLDAAKEGRYDNIFLYQKKNVIILFDTTKIKSQEFDLSNFVILNDPEFDNINLTYEKGENFIKWNWNFTNATIFLDGILIDSDNDLGYYFLICKGNEYHKLNVYDSANETLWYSEIKTNIPFNNILCIWIIIFVFWGFGFFHHYISLLSIVPSSAILIISLSQNLEGWIILLSGFMIPISILISAFEIYYSKEKRGGEI